LVCRPVRPDGIPKGIINQALLKLSPRKDIIAEFLKYWMNSPNFQNELVKLSLGVAIKNVASVKVLKEIQIYLPLIPEQKRIVAILDEAFEGIDSAIANTEKNLANSREIFESYLNAIFTQKEDGWVEKKLEDICEVKDGTHDSPKYVENGIPFITQKNIRENGLIFENIKFISSSDHEKFYSRSNVAYGDILISMIGANRGMACIVDQDRIFSIKNVGLIKASKNINGYFLLYFLKSGKAQMYVEDASRGGAQPFIGLGKLREFPVSVAPQDSQATIVIKLDELYNETQRLEAIYRQKIAALNELKQSILQKAFTGELTADTPKTVKEEIAA
ncbi:restriction endonuclease subunit S, partial [Planktothrix agardhii]|uniref:restriction endonuclease subunit S n=1 Tax=Planktothrix agardhii TaxID=1160 RepID=UPI001F341116